MKEGIMEVCFKNRRDYVHGPDIYDGSCQFLIREEGLDHLEAVDIALHNFARKKLSAQIIKNCDFTETEGSCAMLSCCHGHDRYRVLLFESDSPVDCRREYPEEEILSRCQLDFQTKSIALSLPIPFTDMEIYTAMNKVLVEALYPDMPGKWIISRAQINEYRERSPEGRVEIQMQRNMKFKLTKSAIMIDKEPVGSIFFSLIQPQSRA